MPAYVIAHLQEASPHPEIAEARAWWKSPAYQAIAPLRSRHIEGDIILVEGVPTGYDPTATARAVREALPAE